MIIAVIGSRNFSNFELLSKEFQSFSPSCIISGGANGADRLAAQYANLHNIPLKEIKPDYKKYGRPAPLIRNSQIIREADFILAFWDDESRGTLDTLLKAKKAGKPYKIILFTS